MSPIPPEANGIDWNELGSALIGAVVGGLMSGYAALQSVSRATKEARASRDEQDRDTVRNTVQAIAEELNALFDRYTKSMGAHLDSLPEGEPLGFIFPITGNYFSIFDSNSRHIGAIDDEALRRSIVRVYVVAKGLIDSYKMNNAMAEACASAIRVYMQELAAGSLQTFAAHEEAKLREAALTEYASSLREAHNEAIAALNDFNDLYAAFMLRTAKAEKNGVKSPLRFW